MILTERLLKEPPSRELDAEIADACGVDRAECCNNPIVHYSEKGEPEYEDCCGNAIEIEPMPYTTSIDAALTLVPEGRHLILNIDPYSVACDIKREDGEWGHRGRGTPAVAICIAALKARGVE